MKVTPRAGGTFDVTQSFNPPTVYLDHWAVRDLTDNAAWQQRFIRALHACGGTLVLSHLVFAEFAHGDPRHAVESEQFLDRVFPTVFFASIDMKEVLRKEFRTLEGAPIAPPVDHGLTTHFVTKPVPLSFTCMISPIAKSRKLRNRSKRMSATLAAHINRVRRQPDFKQASRTFKDHVPGKPALAVFRELCRIPGTDQLMRIVPNDAVDLQHAIVALAYCTFVLLDRKWVDFAGRARHKLARLGFPLPIARAFSKPGMADFLDALENHPNLGFPRAGS